jgi:NADP-dependent 3-hydroxy acid dehydrogenase YdfG
MKMSNITNKVVVITGASSGIGESTAKLLAEQGAKVVLGARRSNRIEAVVQEISATGGKAIGFATDVTKRAEVEALILARVYRPQRGNTTLSRYWSGRSLCRVV